MTDSEILKRAIEKAISQGYDFEPESYYYDPEWFINVDHQIVYTNGDNHPTIDYERIIFSHDFAKTFFGSQKHNWHFGQPTCTLCHREGTADVNSDEYCWQTSLQQMVLEENPLKYLEQFLEDKNNE